MEESSDETQKKVSGVYSFSDKFETQLENYEVENIETCVKPSRFVNARALSASGTTIFPAQQAFYLCPSYSNIWQSYTFIEEIGRGASGVVSHCFHKLSKGSVACKTVPKTSLKSLVDITDLQSELKTLRFMQRHPHVVRLLGVLEDAACVHFVTEYCEGGDLFDRIKQKGFYQESDAATVCATLASVLHFAHKNGILHRDLKPENILMASKDSDTDVLLADFGSAATFCPGQKLTQFVGSPLYIAPTVIQHSYCTEADLWSLGVVLHILLCGYPPFWGRTNAEIFRKIQHGSLNLDARRIRDASDEAKDLLRLLLDKEGGGISAAQVLEHPWILRHCGGSKPQKTPPVTEQLPRSSAGKRDPVSWAVREGQKLTRRRYSDGGGYAEADYAAAMADHVMKAKASPKNILSKAPNHYSYSSGHARVSLDESTEDESEIPTAQPVDQAVAREWRSGKI